MVDSNKAANKNISHTATSLFQVRISDSERRHIKMLAASQGVTLHRALVEAFAAWAEKLQSRDTAAPAHQPHAQKPKRRSASRRDAIAPALLERATQLNWARCPEVEIVQTSNRRIPVVRGTLAPLEEVLHSLAQGHSPKEIDSVFQVPLAQLHKLMEFAGFRGSR